MKHGSTIFLRASIILIGLAVLALCVFVLPVGISSDQTGMYRPILLAMYVPAFPFFIALYQAFKLLANIDSNTAFSPSSLKALTIIKYCALSISGLYLAGLPYIYTVAQRDDAPGVMLIGLVCAFGPLIISVFAGVLQKIFQNALEMKTENNLTV